MDIFKRYLKRSCS